MDTHNQQFQLFILGPMKSGKKHLFVHVHRIATLQSSVTDCFYFFSMTWKPSLQFTFIHKILVISTAKVFVH